MTAIVQAGANQPLSFTVGDDVSLRLTVTENSVAYVWTGATVTTSIIANGAAVATNFTTATSAGGILDLSLTDTETTTLGLGTFDYWVKVTKASVTSTWVAGQLTMHAAQYGSASNLSSSLSITTAASTTLAITLSGLSVVGAKLSPGVRWAFFGDSITNASSASNSIYAFPFQSMLMVGGTVARLDSIEAGTPSDTSALLATRVATTFTNYPDVRGSVVMVGMNDSSTPVSPTTFGANLTSIIVECRKHGPVIVCTVTPRASSATAAQRNAIVAYNMWIKMYAPELGYEVADTHSAVVDTTTGYLAAAKDSGDGLHPNDTGHQSLAVEVAKAMKRVVGRSTAYGLLTSVFDTTALLTTDPLSAGGGTKPTGWFEQPGGTGTAPTYSLVADTTSVLPVGKWAQMDFDAVAGGIRRLAVTCNANEATGDVLAAIAHIQIEDISGTWVADNIAATASVTLMITNAAGASISSPMSRCSGIPSATAGIYDIGPCFFPITVPTGTGLPNLWCNVTLPTGKHVKVRFGCVGIVNLTTLGLNTSIGSWSNVLVNT